ncbi:MAG: ABC transporter permease [Anaerolineae bacterium]|nr:ABC transporter permease [Anaerolineae bacterium]
MIRFIAWRIALAAFVAVAIIYFVHLGMHMMGHLSPRYNFFDHSRAAWRETRTFITDAVQEGDFGEISTRRGDIPVKEILADTYANSMGLLTAALGVAAVIGLVAGSLAALSKRIPLTSPVMALTILGISVPSFFAALLLQFGEMQWVRVFGYPLVSVGGFGWDYQHMLLPVLVLAARPIAYLTRATFLGVNRVMSEDYIRTAWAKGLLPRRVFADHTLRNIAIPVLTAVGVSLRFALGSLPVVEFFFGWPGMGERLLSAINNQQTPVVVTLALALGLTFVLVNMTLDISYRFIDPRLKES